jgi:hypothetical protein
LNDLNDNGICDELEESGCTYSWACNYNPNATSDDGSCEITSCAGCTYADASNYDASAIFDDGSCTFIFVSSCPGDFDFDGIVNINDLMLFLSYYGNICSPNVE